MYGYAKVPKYLGCFFRSSGAGIEPEGISDMEGAVALKIPDSCHFFWYLFSISMSVSLFSV